MECMKLCYFDYTMKKLVKIRHYVKECVTSTNVAWGALNAEEKEMFEDFRERVIEEASELCKRYLRAHKALFDCIELVRDRLCYKKKKNG